MLRGGYVSRVGGTAEGAGHRYELLKQMLGRSDETRSILDVGCFVGNFLDYLRNGWNRFGLEPCTEAAAVARSRGINIIGSTIAELDASAHSFDVIVALDVLEHVPSPLEFLSGLRRFLRPRGTLLLLTGDAESLPWTVHGSRYWYCNLPEHVSFFSRRSITSIANSLGLRIVAYHRLSHQRPAPLRTAGELSKNAAYLACRYLPTFGSRKLRRLLFKERPSPMWLTVRDHMCVALRAPPFSRDTQ